MASKRTWPPRPSASPLGRRGRGALGFAALLVVVVEATHFSPTRPRFWHGESLSISFAGFCKTAAGARSSACLNGTHSSDPTIAPRAIGAPGRNFTHPLKGDLSMRGFQRPAPINWPISTHDHRDSSIHLHCLQPPCFSCRPELNTFANGLDETDSSVGVPHVVSYAVPFVLSSLGMPPRRSAQAAGSSRATSSEAGSSSGVSAFFSRMLGRGQGARRGA